MADAAKFAHLHLHTHYSLLDGFNRIPQLVEQTKKLGMNAVAITDHGNLYGAIEFYEACKKGGINPIIGYEAYLAPNHRSEKTKSGGGSGEASTHLTLLAKNRTGFYNLIKLSSIAFLEGFYYKPRIDREVLEKHSEGLICLSGCLAGQFNQFILADRIPDAEKLAKYFAKVFKKNFYIEIQCNGLSLQEQCTPVAADIAAKIGVPLVATADAHYLCASDAIAHDIYFCINTKRQHDPRKKTYPEEKMPNPYYVRSPQDMYKLFPDYADAVARTQQIADGVDIQLSFGRNFPVFQSPRGLTADEFLRELVLQGITERYGDTPAKAVFDRMEIELDVIAHMGYSAYFLIVWDFVKYARDRGIRSTARGSGVGAIVAYTLYISHVCPLEYDLLFERFLDKSRKEPPDIDIDFDQERREEVIQYVKDKYGHKSVAQIGTFGTLGAKAALKDVGRVLSIPLERVNFMCKLVPMKGAISLELKDAMGVPDFRREYDTDPTARHWIDVAMKLEGMNRNVGTHAAGVVIASGDITDYVPVQRVMQKITTDDGEKVAGEVVVTTQWEMGVVEKVGMLKMDFLGLRNLTMLDNTVKLIKKTRGLDVVPETLPLDDPATYKLLQKGDAKGVFQLESDGMRRLLMAMKPDNIRDLIAVLALYRPGPLESGMVENYINRKHGREKFTYEHPVLEEVLGETYGVLCIHEDTRVAMADGSEKPIRDVRAGERVHSLNVHTNRVEAKECEGCGPTRREGGVRVTLENGFSVVLTTDHPLRTWGGWTEAGQLRVGESLVAVPSRAPQECPTVADIARWLGSDEDVAYLLGFLTGDGCLTGSGVTIATGTEPQHRQLCDWLGEHLPALNRHEYHHTRSWYVTVSHPELLNDPAHGNRKTRFHHFLDTLGMKCKATAKRVPNVIYHCPAPVRGAYLAGLFDSDGCFAEGTQGVGVAFLTTASPELRHDVRRLFQLDGVLCTLYPQRVQVWGLAQLRDAIEPFLVLKSFPAKCPSGSKIGWVPRAALQAAVRPGESGRAFELRTGIQRSGLRRSLAVVTSQTATKAGIDLGDVRHLKVRSVEPVADQQFYGISVVDHHNLIANGIVVKNCYQEQIMRILNKLGGIELSKSYAVIKAISKKIPDKIEAGRADWMTGCADRGVSTEVATDIFEKIVFFAGYGFNKSHTAAYAQIGYQTAYLKTHYTAEFMAALLSSEIDEGNKRDLMVDHIADARRLGVDVEAPNVNKGQPDFDVVNGKIVFGLTALKGLGRGASEEVVNAREKGGPYRDLFDFCDRVDLRTVKTVQIEKLIKGGAMDCFGKDKRNAMMHALPRAVAAAEEKVVDKRRGQKSMADLFGGGDDGGGGGGLAFAEVLPDIPEWPDLEKLKFEKEVLDFYMSSHPLAQYDEQLRRFRSADAVQCGKMKAGTEVRLAGMVVEVIPKLVSKGRNAGNRWAIVRIEDFSGAVKCILWSDQFQRFGDLVKADAILLFDGKVEWREGSGEPDVIVDKVMTMDEAKADLTRGLVLRMTYRTDDDGRQTFESVGKILKKARGACPVYLSVSDAGGRAAQFKLSADFFVNPTQVAVEQLEMILGPGSVLFTSR